MNKAFQSDLKKLYQLALNEGNLSIAVEIKELEAKVLLQEKNSSSHFSLENFSDEALQNHLKTLSHLLSKDAPEN